MTNKVNEQRVGYDIVAANYAVWVSASTAIPRLIRFSFGGYVPATPGSVLHYKSTAAGSCRVRSDESFGPHRPLLTGLFLFRVHCMHIQCASPSMTPRSLYSARLYTLWLELVRKPARCPTLPEDLLSTESSPPLSGWVLKRAGAPVPG